MSPFDNAAPEPFQVFREWFALAEESEPNDPNAVALATATLSGAPSLRMVLLKGFDDRGLRFFSGRDSHKGKELEQNPAAAMCLHWKLLRRQVRFEGRVSVLSSAEASEYFHSRSRDSQIAAAVSKQSQVLGSEVELTTEVRKYTSQLGNGTVPTPKDWTGYVLSPVLVEFWAEGKDRLHRRMQFIRDGDGWRAQRLYP